jgi:hypothetical protein
MASIAAIVDAPVDWIGTVDSHLRRGLRWMAEGPPDHLAVGVATILLRPDLVAPPPLDAWDQRLLTLRASGLTREQIARRLGMTPEDVEADLADIRRRLDHVGIRIASEAEKLARLTTPHVSVTHRVEPPPSPEMVEAKRRLRLGTAFLDELHDLLCAEERYQEERASLVHEYKAGQSTFVASVAVVLAPYLGAGVQLVAAAVAVTLSVIGQVGLKAWCATQSQRRGRVGAPPPGTDAPHSAVTDDTGI